MGGAGVALVDDSAAARLNPARLASVNSPEAVVQMGAGSYAGLSTSSDLIRFDRSINPFAGATFDSTAAAGAGTEPGFLAFTYPTKLLARPLGVSLSRTEELNLTIDARSVNRTTPLSAPVTPSGGDEVLRISRGRLDAHLEIYDLAGGWRITPTFAVGAGLTVGRLGLSSETVGLLADPLQFTGPGMFDPRFSGPAAAPLAITRSNGTDTALDVSFGAWWRPHASVSLATVYRGGPRFEIPAVSRDLSSGTRDAFTNVLKQPDTAALGVAWNPFDGNPSATLQSLTLALDLERVRYSDLLDSLRVGENVLTRSDFVRKVRYTASDATEAHLGVEVRRSFLTWTLALRGGLYTDHDGGLRLDSASGDVGALQGQSRAMNSGDFFRGRGSDLHGTFGAGARFYSFSFDVGIDLSEAEDRMVASITCHLPGER